MSLEGFLKMINAALLLSHETVVGEWMWLYSTRQSPEKHTVLAAVAATLLRWLSKNSGNGGGILFGKS